MEKKDIAIGEKVDLHYEKSPYYKTRVEEISERGNLLVQAPIYRGMPAALRTRQELFAYFYRDNGKFTMDARVVGFHTRENLRLVELESLSDLKKEQRREFYRLPVSLSAEALSLPISIHAETRALPHTLPQLNSAISYEDAVEQLTKVGTPEEGVVAKDISSSGLSLRTKSSHEMGDRMVVKVSLGWPSEKSPPISAVVEVRRVEFDSSTGVYALGVEFIGAFAKRDLITKYIFEQQKKRIKLQKLVEE